MEMGGTFRWSSSSAFRRIQYSDMTLGLDGNEYIDLPFLVCKVAKIPNF